MTDVDEFDGMINADLDRLQKDLETLDKKEANAK
jgi:hypothetical protein